MGSEAQLSVITNKLNAIDTKLERKSAANCGLCQGSHYTDQCHLIFESVNFVKDQLRPAYNQSWNQQLRPQNWAQQGPSNWQNQRLWQDPEDSQSWNNNVGPGISGFKRAPPGFGSTTQLQQDSKSTFEETMMKKMDMLLSNNKRYDKMLEERGKMTSLLETNMKNMKVQIGQLAKDLHRRPTTSLPSDTGVNPNGKQQCHAVTLRSGKEVRNPTPKEAESS